MEYLLSVVFAGSKRLCRLIPGSFSVRMYCEKWTFEAPCVFFEVNRDICPFVGYVLSRQPQSLRLLPARNLVLGGLCTYKYALIFDNYLISY